MKTTTHYPDFEVVELTNEDAAEALSDFSGLELETPAQEQLRAAPRRVMSMNEQREIAMKAATGYAWGCVKRDVERTHHEELVWGDHK